MSINTTQEHAVRFVKPISPSVKPVDRWTREAIEELFNLPFNDLLFKAQQIHREHFNPNEVQLSTLLSIKTGGCPEDCSYCPQSVHYNTGVEASKLLDVEEVKAAALDAKTHGASRFCMGAAWREPKDRDVEKVAEATKIAQQRRPDLLIDGPLQYDAASVESVGRQKAPESKVAGRANVFIFPDLNTGNTTYKAVQRAANVVSVGPMLQGLNKPVNDLSRGALVDDIVFTIALTAIQAAQQD